MAWLISSRHRLQLSISHRERLHCGRGGSCRLVAVGLLPALNIRHRTWLRTRRLSSELLFDDRDYSSPQELNRPQHLLMRERGHAHLKRNASEAAKGFVHVKYFF